MNIRTTIEFEDVDEVLEKVVQAGLALVADLLRAKVADQAPATSMSNGKYGAVHTPEDADSVFGRAGAAG